MKYDERGGQFIYSIEIRKTTLLLLLLLNNFIRLRLIHHIIILFFYFFYYSSFLLLVVILTGCCVELEVGHQRRGDGGNATRPHRFALRLGLLRDDEETAQQ